MSKRSPSSDAGLHHISNRLPIGLQPGFCLPDFHIARVDLLERSIELRCRRMLEASGSLRDHRHESDLLKPSKGRPILGLRDGEQEVSTDLDPQLE